MLQPGVKDTTQMPESESVLQRCMYVCMYIHIFIMKALNWSEWTILMPRFFWRFLSFHTEENLSLSLHKHGQAEEHEPTMQLLLSYDVYEMHFYLVIMWVILWIHKQNHSSEQWWDKNVNPAAAFLRDLSQCVVLTDRLFIVVCYCS